ncbi:MAG: hypothetical protein AAF743_15365, partial [Planctomycetota bacterium]
AAITGRDTAPYIERVSKFIRDPAYRAKLGNTMADRVIRHFSFAGTARSIEQLCDALIQRKSEQSAEPAQAEPATPEQPVARFAA